MEKDDTPSASQAPAGPCRDQLFDVIPDALVVVDEDGAIVRVNRYCLNLFGYSESELIGQAVEMLMPAPMRASHGRHRREYQRHPTVRHMKAGLDLMARRKDGSEFPVDIMLSPVSQPVGGTVAVVRDVSVFERFNKEIRHLAYRDSLTGLRNRAALYDDLKKAFQTGGIFAVALLDLDKFKEVNDTLGHSAGDALLKLVAKRCQGSMRDNGMIYRFGGDEFIAVIHDFPDKEAVDSIVARLLDRLAAPFDLEKRTIFINSSAGVAFSQEDGPSVDELLANADLALYRAKAKGGGCHVRFHDSYRAEAVTRNLLNSRLREALEKKRFELFYQPTVSLRDGAIVGAEALLRWRDNGRIIAPSAFIDLLGASPLSEAVGEWILSEACSAASDIRAQGFQSFRIAVNLFPSQLANPAFPDLVERIANRFELNPTGLQLEITETIALQESEAFVGPLRRLRSMGIGLAFDDFGTGFASLSFLTKMPLTHIKLDRSFVTDVPASSKYTAIVSALLRMSVELGLGVIAEGVENEAQAKFLRDCGCDEAQGFLYGRPLPLADFWRLLIDQEQLPAAFKRPPRAEVA